MKGLLIKDLMVLKGRKQMFIIVVFLTAMYGIMGLGAFAMQFLSLMGTTICLSTIAYDNMDNGTAFLFALPFTRKQYVAEKYLFGI